MDENVMNLNPAKLNGLCLYCINCKGGMGDTVGRKERKGGNEKRAMEMSGEVAGVEGV